MSTKSGLAYYYNHKSICNKRNRQWRINNRERYNELQRRWRKNTPGAIEDSRERARQWRLLNPDKALEHHKKWYLKHRDREIQKNSLKAKIRRQRPEVKERERELHKIWVKNNPEKVAAKARRWRLKHLSQVRVYANNAHHARRARKRGNTVNPQSITRFIKAAKSKRFAVCYYCQETISTQRIHFDHIVPLSKGGAHSVENLCVSCESCNQTKYTKLLKDFVTLGQQLLEL